WTPTREPESATTCPRSGRSKRTCLGPTYNSEALRSTVRLDLGINQRGGFRNSHLSGSLAPVIGSLFDIVLIEWYGSRLRLASFGLIRYSGRLHPKLKLGRFNRWRGPEYSVVLRPDFKASPSSGFGPVNPLAPVGDVRSPEKFVAVI